MFHQFRLFAAKKPLTASSIMPKTCFLIGYWHLGKLKSVVILDSGEKIHYCEAQRYAACKWIMKKFEFHAPFNLRVLGASVTLLSRLAPGLCLIQNGF